MESWGQLRRRIESFLTQDSKREISEESELLFEPGAAEYCLEEIHGKLLLHLWSDERNWVRRVVGVVEETPERLVLQVERFGRRPGRLAIATPRRRAERERERAATRRKYGSLLRRLLQREFPRCELDGLSTSADLRRSFSGLYTRARLREGGRWWAVMGVNDGEDSAAVDGILTYALIWLDWNRKRYPDHVWAGLRLFLPAGRTQTTANRLAFLNPELTPAEVFGVDQKQFDCLREPVSDWGNLQTRVQAADHHVCVRSVDSPLLDRIRTLAPEEIESVVGPGRQEPALRFRGLEFARMDHGRLTFGIEGSEEELSPENFPALENLVTQLRRERTADATPASPYYRLQAERWLESLILARPHALDPRLGSGRLYRQVLVAGGNEQGRADLVGTTGDGQLVVVEIKASTDIHLPLQGLDYWLRIRWHHERGDLAAAGYFRDVRLKPSPPELLLAAPALQLHPTTERLVSYFDSSVRTTIVGINEDWRRELKVVTRLPR